MGLYPVGDPPSGAYQWGARFGQDVTEQSAKAAMVGDVEVPWNDAAVNHHTNVSIDSPLWKTIDGNEESTFPRSNLNYGAAGLTASGGSGDSGHSHNLTRVPDYQPGGNILEIGFIKVQTNCELNAVGFITGDSATWLNTGGTYVAVYKMNDINGDLTRVWVSGNVQSAAQTMNSETRIPVPIITALKAETYAVGIMTHTSGLQKPGSLMCTTLTDIGRGSTATSAFPRRQYGWAGGYPSSGPPVHLAESDINFGNSNKVPFFFLRRATPNIGGGF